MTNIDYSTIDAATLSTLRAYSGGKTRELSQHLGSGCFLDAPGYPSHFVQNVYTATGNTPRTGTEAVIAGKALPLFVGYEEREALFRRLWAPLPLEHPRVQAWMQYCYAYFKNCYDDVTGIEPPEYGRPALLIYPIPKYKMAHAHIDDRWRQDVIGAALARVDAHNADQEERYAAVCIPEHHRAVRRIRTFYPNAPIRFDWIDNPPANPGNWWERHAERPSADECPGDRQANLSHDARPWCQFCGRTSVQENAR